MSEKLYTLKLTRVEINHILYLLSRNKEEGSYIGPEEEYRARHERIIKKIHGGTGRLD
jgi:hypothetical protein